MDKWGAIYNKRSAETREESVIKHAKLAMEKTIQSLLQENQDPLFEASIENYFEADLSKRQKREILLSMCSLGTCVPASRTFVNFFSEGQNVPETDRFIFEIQNFPFNRSTHSWNHTVGIVHFRKEGIWLLANPSNFYESGLVEDDPSLNETDPFLSDIPKLEGISRPRNRHGETYNPEETFITAKSLEELFLKGQDFYGGAWHLLHLLPVSE